MKDDDLSTPHHHHLQQQVLLRSSDEQEEKRQTKDPSSSSSSSSKFFQWRSPLLEISTETTYRDIDTMSTHNHHLVNIPESGWYGLCFAKAPVEDTASLDDDDEDDDNDDSELPVSSSDEERNVRRAQKSSIDVRPSSSSVNSEMDCSRRDSSCVKTTPNKEHDRFMMILKWKKQDDTTTTTTACTPSAENQSSKTATIPIRPLQEITSFEIAVDIGKLYFFPTGCSVKVVQTASASSSSASLSSTRTSTRWFLLYRRWVSRAIDAALSGKGSEAIVVDDDDVTKSSNNNINNNNTNNSLPRLAGVCPAIKKTIICAECSKRFPVPRAAIGHRNQVHRAAAAAAVTAAARQEQQQQQQRNEEKLPEKLNVLWQDKYMAVIDKPQGIAVMGDKQAGASLHRSNLLMQLIVPVEDRDYETLSDGTTTSRVSKYKWKNKPVPVHRLDRATGGILVIAKTKEADSQLKTAFMERKCHKRYRALVLGRLEASSSSSADASQDVSATTNNNNNKQCCRTNESIIELPIDGKPSKTKYQVVAHYECRYTTRDGWVTVVDLFPETGRRHQLRKHMKLLGHSIWGDRRYMGIIDVSDADNDITATDITVAGTDAASGGGAENPHEQRPPLMSRLCLWAVELTVPHPVTNKSMTFTLQNPQWLEHVIQQIKK